MKSEGHSPSGERLTAYRYGSTHVSIIAFRTGICIPWGGDEFLVVTPVCSKIAHEKIIRNIKSESKKFSDAEPHIGLAVGGALRLKPDIEEAEILKATDWKMYQNKTSHKQRTLRRTKAARKLKQ